MSVELSLIQLKSVCVSQYKYSYILAASVTLLMSDVWRMKEPLQDSIIATYEEHEDSVYAVEWSAADPWLFASLSYDGRLVINRVPRALKYRILL